MRSERVRNAAQASLRARGLGGSSSQGSSNDVETPDFPMPKVHKKLAPGMAAKRRTCIEFLFVHILESPTEDTWLRDGVVSGIMRHLQVSEGCSKEVKVVLKAILAAQAAGKKYDVHERPKRRGRTAKIQELTVQAKIVYDALETGLSTTQAGVILNEWCTGQDPPLAPVSWSAVEGFVLRSDVINRTRSQTKKSGKEDAGSNWAVARECQAKQFRRQLELGKLPVDSEAVLSSIAAGLPPIHQHRIAWWDENHKGVILGFTSKFENHIAKNEYKEATPQQFGGVLQEKKMQTHIKFPGEVCGCFGAAVVEDEDGTCRGVKAVPFNYTGKWVVGIKAYELAKVAEMARVPPLVDSWSCADYGYKDKYGDNWEKELEAVIRRGNASRHALVCITDVIDHVISESKCMYAGTSCEDTFIIFHYGLKQWWEKEAQAYIREKGYPRRFGMGTPPRGLEDHGTLLGDGAYQRAHRAGRGRLEMVLDKIIEYKGCVVPDEYLRHGRRARAANGKRDLKNKPCARQRTSTMVARPCHPDCEEAGRLLKNPKALEDDAKALSLLMDADTDDEEDEVEKALREADEDRDDGDEE
ncbi:hypothetical protein B484DRAFT_464846 [Ochromonadaceae sp. CCMP2298]|nr:hypothetical protein B484DRAFT_464846 [Ochromonadaceae sp. CCMP2298]